MPTYDYECAKCGTFELFQSMKDDALKVCPHCKGKKITRLIGTGAGIIFKGSGFYETDYRSESYKKGKSAAESSKEAASSDSSSSSSDSSSSSSGTSSSSAGTSSSSSGSAGSGSGSKSSSKKSASKKATKKKS